MPRHRQLPENLTPAAFQILMALADMPRHGLGIIQEVKEGTGGEVTLGPGTLYGTIKRLREGGLIMEATGSSSRDTRRRYYELTPKGREALVREVRAMELMVSVARHKALLNGPGGS